MTEEEIKDHLRFKSFCTYNNGPQCHCRLSKLDHFSGFLPDEACGKEISEVEFKKPLETTVSALCGCQECHAYILKIGPEGINFEETEVELMDKGKLNLPNFRNY